MVRLSDEQVRECVGLKARYVAPDPIGAAAFRYFAQAIGDANPVYLDTVIARELGHDSVIAPPTLVCETNQYTGRDPDENGYSGHAWPLELQGATWIRGGNEYRFGRPLRPDDQLSVEWSLVEAANKTGRDGTEMVMIVSEAIYRNQVGDFLAWNRETMFYT